MCLTDWGKINPEPSSNDINYFQEWKKKWLDVNFDELTEKWLE
jgi:hypothetical protein